MILPFLHLTLVPAPPPWGHRALPSAKIHHSILPRFNALTFQRFNAFRKSSCSPLLIRQDDPRSN